MKQLIVYVHGQGGAANEADHYRPLFGGCEVVGFDYHAQTPGEAREEFPRFFDPLRAECDSLVLIANSIGAFFSMTSLLAKQVDRAMFISPVVDMEALIAAMMARANVSEEELRTRREIKTASGETLSWDWLCDVRNHPLRRTRLPDAARHDVPVRRADRRAARGHARRRTLVPHPGTDGVSRRLDRGGVSPPRSMSVPPSAPLPETSPLFPGRAQTGLSLSGLFRQVGAGVLEKAPILRFVS